MPTFLISKFRRNGFECVEAEEVEEEEDEDGYENRKAGDSRGGWCGTTMDSLGATQAGVGLVPKDCIYVAAFKTTGRIIVMRQ